MPTINVSSEFTEKFLRDLIVAGFTPASEKEEK